MSVGGANPRTAKQQTLEHATAQGGFMAFKWLTRLAQQSPAEDQDSSDLRRAIAVLMLEVAQSDFDESEEETKILVARLTEHISEEGETTESLIANARSDKANSAGLYQFTRLACNEMSVAERCHLVEQLWEIAYADGVIDKYEEAAIRKVSELLYVPHADFIKAKLTAGARANEAYR